MVNLVTGPGDPGPEWLLVNYRGEEDASGAFSKYCIYFYLCQNWRTIYFLQSEEIKLRQLLIFRPLRHKLCIGQDMWLLQCTALTIILPMQISSKLSHFCCAKFKNENKMPHFVSGDSANCTADSSSLRQGFSCWIDKL